MKPETMAAFRGFLSLRDIADDDDPQNVFNAMAATAAWAAKQRVNQSDHHDQMLTGLQGHTALWMGLLLHLATVDRLFFDLAKRMAARTLVRHDPPAKVYCRMAAALLTSAPPRKPNPTLSRDVAMIIGISVLQNLGVRPTEGEKSGPMNRSGCGQMVEALTNLGVEKVTYGNVERIWLGRTERLQDAEFIEQNLSDFFGQFAGVKNG